MRVLPPATAGPETGGSRPVPCSARQGLRCLALPLTLAEIDRFVSPCSWKSKTPFFSYSLQRSATTRATTGSAKSHSRASDDCRYRPAKTCRHLRASGRGCCRSKVLLAHVYACVCVC